MQNRVNSFTGFQPLKEVWLGDCYPEHFYSHLSNEVQDAFGIITEWTRSDLNKIQRALESAGVLVQRPKFSNRAEDHAKNGQLVKPPICPRDDNLTLGNEFYHLRAFNNGTVDPWFQQVTEFYHSGVSVHEDNTWQPLDCLYPPSVVRIGRDVYIDYDTHQHVWGQISGIIIHWAKNYRVHVCRTDGHSDGVFCPVAPGTIVATHYLSEYEKTFPNWQVFKMPAPRESAWTGKWSLKSQNVMNNIGFADHINQHAFDWIGNYKETVFEANMLVINPKHVLAIKEDPQMFKWLDQQGIKITVCDFRCREFWDGGLHCLTTDIVRDGGCEDYFPERPRSNYLDWLC